jgi:hypothetical protein
MQARGLDVNAVRFLPIAYISRKCSSAVPRLFTGRLHGRDFRMFRLLHLGVAGRFRPCLHILIHVVRHGATREAQVVASHCVIRATCICRRFRTRRRRTGSGLTDTDGRIRYRSSRRRSCLEDSGRLLAVRVSTIERDPEATPRGRY